LLGIAHLAESDASRLSGGELQRVALARALVLRPEIIFLDEPSSALDPSLRAHFRQDLMAAARSLGSTVVLVTHDQSEAIALADHLAILQDGRLVQQGKPDDVIAHPRNRLVASFLGAETIWRGRVEGKEDGVCRIRTRAGLPVEVVSSCAPGEEVTVAIRAEDVALTLDDATPGGSSVRNRWRGTVEDLIVEGSVVRVRVCLGADADEALGAGLSGLGPLDMRMWLGKAVPEQENTADACLTALVTRPSARDLGLARGTSVRVAVKATAVHLLED
jgi:ABC-type Fe3+/spermidine/putrescine transport system ATPase subunit